MWIFTAIFFNAMALSLQIFMLFLCAKNQDKNNSVTSSPNPDSKQSKVKTTKEGPDGANEENLAAKWDLADPNEAESPPKTDLQLVEDDNPLARKKTQEPKAGKKRETDAKKKEADAKKKDKLCTMQTQVKTVLERSAISKPKGQQTSQTQVDPTCQIQSQVLTEQPIPETGEAGNFSSYAFAQQKQRQREAQKGKSLSNERLKTQNTMDLKTNDPANKSRKGGSKEKTGKKLVYTQGPVTPSKKEDVTVEPKDPKQQLANAGKQQDGLKGTAVTRSGTTISKASGQGLTQMEPLKTNASKENLQKNTIIKDTDTKTIPTKSGISKSSKKDINQKKKKDNKVSPSQQSKLDGVVDPKDHPTKKSNAANKDKNDLKSDSRKKKNGSKTLNKSKTASSESLKKVKKVKSKSKSDHGKNSGKKPNKSSKENARKPHRGSRDKEGKPNKQTKSKSKSKSQEGKDEKGSKTSPDPAKTEEGGSPKEQSRTASSKSDKDPPDSEKEPVQSVLFMMR